jgi:2-dehydropantoate 2-reductase
MSPKIAFLGTGAQGAGIGADLVRAGLDVTFIEQWPAHVDAMRANGIEVRMPEQTVVTPLAAVLNLCDVATLREKFDVVFLLVKAYDTRWACELIKPVLADDGLVVGLQNGMSMASNMWEPGIVNRQNSPATAWFTVGGVVPSAQARAHEVQALLSHAGTVEVSSDIRSSKWMKLIANAGELVPSAILNLPLAEAAALPGVHEFMVECGKEAARATIADGCTLVPIFGMTADDVVEADAYAELLLGRVLSDYSFPDTLTTVLQDWRKGRRAEVAEVNGLAVDVLRAHGQAAPANERTVELARRIESGALEAQPSNVDLLLAVAAR